MATNGRVCKRVVHQINPVRDNLGETLWIGSLLSSLIEAGSLPSLELPVPSQALHRLCFPPCPTYIKCEVNY